MSTYISNATIQLNNIGVALIDQHCFHQGMHIFADALRFVRLASDDTSQGLAIEFLSGIREVQHKADQELSNPRAMVVQEKVPITVLSDDDNPSSVSLERLLYLIRIEPIDFESDDDALPVLTSVILHNYAVAYRCLAALSEETCHRHSQKAFHLFQMAFSTLSFFSSCDGCDKTLLEEYQHPRRLLLTLLMLHHLVEITCRLQMESERIQYTELLDLLKRKLDRLNAVVEMLPPQSAAAA